jgi:hypothetical protein
MKRTLVRLSIAWLFCCGFLQARAFEEIPLPEGSRNDQPQIVFSPDGTLWAAWPCFLDGRFHVAVARRRAGTWSPVPRPVSSPDDQIQPVLAPRAPQGVSLLFTALSDKGAEVSLIEHDGSSWGEPVALGPGTRPAAAFDGRRLWTAWQSGGGILFRPAGSSPRPLSQPAAESGAAALLTPVLAAGPEGAVWLACSLSRPGGQSILLRRIDRDGSPLLRVDDGRGVNRDPRLSIDRGGRVWIVYEKLIPFESPTGSTWDHSGRPVYLMDRGYRVEYPSRTIRVTDGEKWWTPVEPERPAAGLMPAVYCSSAGPVLLISRAFPGYERPYRYFSPLLETLGAGGWENHEGIWPYDQSYKAAAALAEDPQGRVWAAWARHDRVKKGMRDTPSWSHLDGPDRLLATPLPVPEAEGNPRLLPLDKPAPPPAAALPKAPPRFQADLEGETLNVYFGDLHQHCEFSGCGRWNGRIDQNQSYTRHVRGLDFMCTIDHAEHLNAHTWRKTQLAARMSDRPDLFAAFTGFEWTSEFDAGGNLFRGHYNALFRTVGAGDTYFSASDPRYNTPLELWDALRAAVGGPENVLTFAHHTSRRMAWLTWNYYDPEMAPLIEIAQARGSYEYEGCYSGPGLDNDCARVSGHYIRDGLDRGMRWGFAAAGDHGGRQLTAVFAPRLTRDEIFRGLKARRAYATNGEKMFLDVRVDGRFMGGEYTGDGGPRRIEISAEGTAPLVEIDLFRNGRSVKKWTPGRRRISLEYEDAEPLFERENYYYARLLQDGGGMAWSSPVWVIDASVPGAFRFQVGGDELRVVYPDREEDFAVLMHNSTGEAVRGTVSLDTPEGWQVREKAGVAVDCPAGSWRHAVFHVTAPSGLVPRPCLPDVTARFETGGGTPLESPLFVVASPRPLTREQKAQLIDARARLPRAVFPEYFRRAVQSFHEEQP